MLMADTLAIFFTVLGLMLATPGLWLLCRGLWPDLVKQSAVHCRVSLVKPFFIGLPIAVFAVIAVAIFSKLPQPMAAFTIIGFICLLLIYAHIGVTAIASILGERLPSPADIDRPWNATVRGGVVLELSYLLPVIGWFVILPVSLIIGAGLTTRSLIATMRTKDRKELKEQNDLKDLLDLKDLKDLKDFKDSKLAPNQVIEQLKLQIDGSLGAPS